MNRLHMQKKNLDALARNGGFQFTETFLLYTSGEIGPYYVQSIDVEKSGQDYKEACDSITSLIYHEIHPETFDVISGGESRDWDFSNVVAYNFTKPHCKIYNDGRILGADVGGKRILHVADLNNKGSSMRDKWVPTIRKNSGKITDAVFYVERMEKGVDVLSDLNIRGHSVVVLDSNAWDFLKERGTINDAIYSNLLESMHNPDAWAIKMLASEKGIARLVELSKKEETMEKANKSLEYYINRLPEDYIGILNERGFKFHK